MDRKQAGAYCRAGRRKGIGQERIALSDSQNILDLKEQFNWPDPILRVNSLCRIFDCSRSTIKSWVSRGILPKPLKLNISEKALGWRRSDVQSVFDNMKRVA